MDHWFVSPKCLVNTLIVQLGMVLLVLVNGQFLSKIHKPLRETFRLTLFGGEDAIVSQA